MGILTGTYSDKAAPVSSGPGAGRTSAPSAPAGTSTGRVSTKTSDAQKASVRTMQQVIQKLVTDLQDENNAKNAYDQIVQSNGGKAPTKYQTPQAISQEAKAWGDTAIRNQPGASPADGIWGSGTKGALERIKLFVEDCKIGGVLIQEGTGPKPYLSMDDASITKIADDNIKNLARLFQGLGMAVPSDVSTKATSGFLLDQVPRELSDEAAESDDVWPTYWGDVLVTVGDVRSFDRFFQLLTRLSYTECRPLEGEDRDVQAAGLEARRSARSPGAARKRDEIDVGYADDDIESVAAEILDRSIFRMAQDPEPAPQHVSEEYNKNKDYAGRSKGNIGTGQDRSVGSIGSGLCFYSIDDMMNWFAARAASIYSVMYYARQESSPNPRPDRKGPVTDQDLRAAQGYRAAISSLLDQWNDMKNAVLGMIKDPDKPVVTYEMVRHEARHQAGVKGLGGAGAGRSGDAGSGGPGSGGAMTIPGGGGYEGSFEKGPIHEFMPLGWMGLRGWSKYFQKAVGELKNLSLGGKLPDLHRQEWQGGDWVAMALANVAGETDSERISDFPKWAQGVRETLRELYVNWQSNSRNLSKEVIGQQNNEWRLWNESIRNLIADAQRGMPDALTAAGKSGEEFVPEWKQRQRDEENTPYRPAPAVRAPAPREVGSRESKQRDKLEAATLRQQRKDLRRGR